MLKYFNLKIYLLLFFFNQLKLIYLACKKSYRFEKPERYVPFRHGLCPVAQTKFEAHVFEVIVNRKIKFVSEIIFEAYTLFLRYKY